MIEPTTEEIKETLKTSRALVAYFSTPDCNVCKVLRPRVEAMTVERQDIDFVYIDSAKHPRISGQNLVFAVPTIAPLKVGKVMWGMANQLAAPTEERSIKPKGIDTTYATMAPNKIGIILMNPLPRR